MSRRTLLRPIKRPSASICFRDRRRRLRSLLVCAVASGRREGVGEFLPANAHRLGRSPWPWLSAARFPRCRSARPRPCAVYRRHAATIRCDRNSRRVYRGALIGSSRDQAPRPKALCSVYVSQVGAVLIQFALQPVDNPGELATFLDQARDDAIPRGGHAAALRCQ